MHIRKAKTVKERWDAITTEYTEKGTFAQTDLCTCFLESKCPEKGNVQQFLDELRIKREELATVGVNIDEKDLFDHNLLPSHSPCQFCIQPTCVRKNLFHHQDNCPRFLDFLDL